MQTLDAQEGRVIFNDFVTPLLSSFQASLAFVSFVIAYILLNPCEYSDTPWKYQQQSSELSFIYTCSFMDMVSLHLHASLYREGMLPSSWRCPMFCRVWEVSCGFLCYSFVGRLLVSDMKVGASTFFLFCHECAQGQWKEMCPI